jgi:CHRD domain
MNRGRVIVVGLAVLALGVSSLSAAASGGTMGFTARLSARQEVPRQAYKNRKASGRFTGKLKKTKNGYRLYWRLTFRRLSGRAIAAHIQKARRGKYGPAMAALCAPCRSGAHGSLYFSPFEMAFANDGLLYVNVRTAKNRAGEIRGQITR